MIIKASHYLNKDGLLNYSFVYIYIYLLHCNHICGSTFKTNLNYLVVLQNKALHVISHMKPRCSTEPLYKELDVTKFDNIVRGQNFQFSEAH